MLVTYNKSFIFARRWLLFMVTVLVIEACKVKFAAISERAFWQSIILVGIDLFICPTRLHLSFKPSIMLRQSVSLLSQAAVRSAASSTSSASCSASASRLAAATAAGRRHYSEATASEGAEAASSANPEQQKQQEQSSASSNKKEGEAKAAGVSNEQLAKDLEKVKKDFAEMKVSSHIYTWLNEFT